MKLLRNLAIPVPKDTASYRDFRPIDTGDRYGNGLRRSVFSFGLNGCLFAVGGFFQNRLIEITQNAQTDVQGLVKFSIIGSFEISLQVGVGADTHPGSDSQDGTADP